MLPAFQSRRLPAYCAKAVEQALRLCDHLAEQASADGCVRIDTDAVMARLTLDIASSTLFASVPPGNGEEIETAIRILSETAFPIFLHQLEPEYLASLAEKGNDR